MAYVTPMRHEFRDLWNGPIKTFRKDNLVYVSIPKCQFTYYGHVFDANKWTPETVHIKDIDFEKHTVFGFIVNPYRRYLKGITQDIWIDKKRDEVADAIINLSQKGMPIMSLHSLPISTMFGDKMFDIDWIPLHTGVNPDVLLEKFMEFHNCSFVIPEISPYKRNASSEIKLKLHDRLANNLGIGSNYINQLVSYDMDFFKQVTERTDPTGKTWDQISWLHYDARQLNSQAE